MNLFFFSIRLENMNEEEKVTDDEQKSFEELATRSAAYMKSAVPLSDGFSSEDHRKSSKRNLWFLKCCEHNPKSKRNDTWANGNVTCPSCFVFSPSTSFPSGVLPTNISIIQQLMGYKETRSKQGGVSDRMMQSGSPEWQVSNDVALHWIFCNVYPCATISIIKKVESLYSEFLRLRRYVHDKKKETYWTDYTSFTEKLSSIMDVRADSKYTQKQEKFWGCIMSETDKTFYKLQREIPPTGYCETYVDTKWKKMKERKMARENHSRQEHYQFVRNDERAHIGNYDEESDPTYIVEEPKTKKRKYEYVEDFENEVDELPYKFRHLRLSQRSVRPEVYQVITKMKSKYHMSQAQAEGVEVGNYLFHRKWKRYDKCLPTDHDTLPAGSNMRRVEPYFEAMAISSIVEKIMLGKELTVTYSNDGSAMSGVGNYVVQSSTINKIQRVLPTFSIFTESRESLVELEEMTLQILSAATGYRYTVKEILANIHYVMTDSTTHNLK